jgi:hypothetical protein
MTIAEKCFEKQIQSEEFKRSFQEEKVKLDIECRLEQSKSDIKGQKSADELIDTVDAIDRFVASV